ncbi:hypothetical protein JST97_21095 [bacterium]|nr:hypothetical protein [bacterium]
MHKRIFAFLLFTLSAYADLAPGTEIEFYQSGVWSRGKVVEKVQGGYHIVTTWTDGSPWDLVITEAKVRAAGPAAAPAATTAPTTANGGTLAPGTQVEWEGGGAWTPGTVIAKVQGGYRIMTTWTDGSPWEVVATDARVRPAQGARPAEGNPIKPTRMPIDQSLERPTAALIQAVMRAQWEHEAYPGQDGAVTASFQNISIGAPRGWNGNDQGQGDYGTTVWPATVNWTWTTHYRGRNEVQVKKWVVSVFKNRAGRWEVSQSSVPGQTSETHNEPPDM